MINHIEAFVKERLNGHPKRLHHVMGVKDTAATLASIHGVDVDKATIAALFHDVTKYDAIADQIKHLDKNIVQEYQDYPVMYHALSAAKLLEDVFDIHDKDILNAIKHHIWGASDMSPLEKIIFIADSCEPGRDFADAPFIYQVATTDLDQATWLAMKASIDYLEKKGFTPSQEQLNACQYYQEVICGKTK